MKKITWQDIENSSANRRQLEKLFYYFNQIDAKIESDFSGNLFYVEQFEGWTSTKPLYIQIKELADVPEIERGKK